MFAITCRLSIPLVLVALALVSAAGSSLPGVALTLGLLLWDRFAVVSRAVTRQIRVQDYVAAAWCAGAGTRRRRWPAKSCPISCRIFSWC